MPQICNVPRVAKRAPVSISLATLKAFAWYANFDGASVMSIEIEIDESVQKRIETVTSEQFDAFERQDREIRMEERRERAMQLQLPTALADKTRGAHPWVP